MKWYKKVIKNYAVFDGRARRTEYWMFVLINFLILLGLSLVEFALGIPSILTIVYNLALLIPSLAVAIRRLHDTGKTGWWLLIGLIPIIGAIVLIVFYCQESDDGANHYGESPKQAA